MFNKFERNEAVVQEKIKIDFRARTAKLIINVADFVDHGHVVVYIPSLDLSAYGPTKDEAIKMLFDQVVSDYVESLMKIPESKVSEELAKYGWKRGKILKKNFSNEAFVDAKGILQNFNLPAETPININHQIQQVVSV
jgi:hypothetical protein